MDRSLTSDEYMNGAGYPYSPADFGFANEDEQPSAKLDTGMHADTRVQTPSGPTAIADLTVGASVCDPDGSPATIRAILNAPRARHALRLRAPYFGLDQDLVVGVNHMLTMTSDTAEYLFGTETVSLPVWALRDNRRVLHHELRSRDTLHQLQLDRAADLAVGNCAIGSLEKHNAPVARVLNDHEARCFAAEYKVGFFN